MEGKDNFDNTSGPGHDTVSAILTGDAQRKPAQSRTQISTRLRAEPLASVQGEIMGSGCNVQNCDERIASSVNERAEKRGGAIAKEDDVLMEQETSKNTGGAKAQKIMDELNDAARMAKKIAELQVPKLQKKKSQQKKLKQQVSNVEKQLEEQRALEIQLENRNAEIDRLRVDLSVARTNSEEKDREINQLRDSLERLRQEAGQKSTGLFLNARDASLENPAMAHVQGDFNLNTDREKRVDELPIPADGMSPPIFTERKAQFDLVSKSSPGQFMFASTAALFIAFFFFYYQFLV